MRAILTYHSIDDSGSPISVSETAFGAHCRFLASGRVRVVPLEQLQNVDEAEDAVAVTFDDGFVNFAEKALPELEDAGLSSTLFIVSDKVGAHNDWGGKRSRHIPHLPLMTWDQVANLPGRGVSLGAHTRRHPALTQLAEREALLDEVEGSLREIRSHTGVEPKAFAYPYGDVDERVASVVRNHFAVGCTTELRVLGHSEDSVRLPRLDMFYFREPGQLEGWGTTAFRSRIWLRSQGRRLKQLARSARARQESAA